MPVAGGKASSSRLEEADMMEQIFPPEYIFKCNCNCNH